MRRASRSATTSRRASAARGRRASVEEGSYLVAVGPSSEPDARVRIGPDLRSRRITGIVLAIAGFLVSGTAALVLAAWGISAGLRDATRNG